MICNNCGATIKDNANVCIHCGQATTLAFNATPAKKPKKKLLFGLIAVGAIVAGIIILETCFFGGGNAEGVTGSVVNAIYSSQSGRVILGAMPEEVVDAITDEWNMTEEELGESIENALWKKEGSFGSKFYSAGICDTKKLDKDEIEELEEQYEDQLNVNLKITAAREIEYKVEVSLDGRKEINDIIELTAIKVGGRWYIDYFSVVKVYDEL